VTTPSLVTIFAGVAGEIDAVPSPYTLWVDGLGPLETIPPPPFPLPASPMNRQEFVQNYLEPQQRRMAIALLPEGTRPLEEWRSLWQAALNSPAY
jgi:hypothetical protein